MKGKEGISIETGTEEIWEQEQMEGLLSNAGCF